MQKMIRPATPADAVFVVPLIVQALVPGAFQLTNSGEEAEAYPVVTQFFLQETNRHSYRNTLVYENEAGIVGSIVSYDGAQDEALGMPITLFLRSYYQSEDVAHFAEGEAGAFYIDTVSVRKDQQGRGIGQALIAAACARAKSLGHQYISLLVDKENPSARRLYERLGFAVAKERRLWEHDYAYMQHDLG
jgi:ribosomal protein S18 acetylase RimI-like enzyme